LQSEESPVIWLDKILARANMIKKERDKHKGGGTINEEN
jgi:hypothetical protein